MAKVHSPSSDGTPSAEKDSNESPWASPSTKRAVNKDGVVPNDGQTMFERVAARETSLRAELASVRKVNEAIEGMVESLNKAQTNMKVVNSTVSSASSLLNTWTRILSQTEHNHRLILNPTWQGASQDIADIEQEVILKQRASERREVEEHMRREEKLRKTEEDEKRRKEAMTAPTTRTRASTRSRGRGTGRTVPTGSTTNTARSGSRNTSAPPRGRNNVSNSRRTTSGIGRGYAAGRGRGARE